MEPQIIADLIGYMDWVASLPWCETGIRTHLPDWWTWGCPFFVFGERLESVDRKRISRGVQSLVLAGQLERICRGNGSKTTHVRPSTGLMRSLLAEADDDLAESLRHALRRSCWGQELLRTLAEVES